MEAGAALRSLHWTNPQVACTLEKACLSPLFCITSHKSLLPQGLSAGRWRICSPIERKRPLFTYAKASEAESALLSSDQSDKSLQEGSAENRRLQGTTFPNGFEALILEVCDETEVAELKVKVGGFEMHMKRNIGASVVATPPIASPTIPPPVPSKPMVESGAAAPPPKAAPTATNPLSNVSPSKASKLASLESSGSNNYLLVSSPTVGSFRRGRTVKGKKQPPICKEGDVIKEGQVIGYVDQFGSELPVRSDVAGEVLKLLYIDGENNDLIKLFFLPEIKLEMTQAELVARLPHKSRLAMGIHSLLSCLHSTELISDV